MPIRFSLLRFSILAILVQLLSAETGKSQLFSTKSRGNGDLNSSMNNGPDSSTKKSIKTNDSILIYYFTLKDRARTKIDSTIHTLHRSPLLSEWQTDLGNFGSAAQTVFFNPSLSPANQLGIQSNASFLFDANKVKFYNTTRPYTDLYYRVGTKQEQILEITHSRNISPQWNMTASYRKAGSAGSYQLQRTNNDNLFVSSNYTSVNERYLFTAAVIYNKIQQDENGGVLSEEYLNSSNYNNKRLVPVILDKKSGETNRSNMTNYYRDLSLQLKHQYFFGQRDSLFNIDSSEKIYTFKPIIGLKHTLYAGAAYYSFKDLTPDSLYYSKFGQLSFVNNDSVYSTYDFNQIGNTFSLTGDVRVREKTLQAEAGYGLELDRVKNSPLNENYINNYLFAAINKRADKEREWLYNASLKFYFTGNLIGNALLSAKAGRNFSERYGQVRIGFDQTIQQSPFMLSEYHTNFYSFASGFKKQTISKVNLTYRHLPTAFSVQLNYYLLANYIYRDTSLLSKQYAKVIPLTHVMVFKKFRVRRFVFENNLLGQFVSSNAPIHLPLFASSSRLAYESRVLKKKLNISTGIDCRYNMPFYTDNYSPLVYGFVTQYDRKISNVPRLGYFFNFKVKTFRGSLCVDEIQQLFTRNNINYAMYPGQNFMFRFGFHWMFVN